MPQEYLQYSALLGLLSPLPGTLFQPPYQTVSHPRQD